MAYSKLENRVWSLEAENVQMRDDIRRLKSPLPKETARPITKHKNLIEYSEPAMTR